MRIAPRNELELIFRFAQEMPKDWELLRLQWDFPDATLRIDGEIYRAEFEHKSKNFVGHGHDLMQADLIICWMHNWHDCPLPVLELRNPNWIEIPLFKVTRQEKEPLVAARQERENSPKRLKKAWADLKEAMAEKVRVKVRIKKASRRIESIERNRKKREEMEAIKVIEKAAKNAASKIKTATGRLPEGTLITHRDYPDFRGVIEGGDVRIVGGWRGPTVPNYPIWIPLDRRIPFS